MEKVIIDTDPGVDDALALMMACSAQLEIVGITTVFGNSTIENTTKNALAVLQLLEKNIPVYEGAKKPIEGRSVLAKSHGENGLGGYVLPKLKCRSQGEALDFLIRILEMNPEKSINIIVIGPSTNIALLNTMRPDLAGKINKLILLGGVFNEKGNITPFAEFNVYNDPSALLNSLTIDCEKVLIPADVCRKVIFSKDDFDAIENIRLKDQVKKITDIYINYYMAKSSYGGFKGGVMYDLLTVGYFLKSSMFTTAQKYVEVDVGNNRKKGRTFIGEGKKSNCTLVLDVDPQRLKKLFFSVMNSKTSNIFGKFNI